MGVQKKIDALNTSGIPEDAKRMIKENKISIIVDRRTNKIPKYTKRKFLMVSDSYDAFENFGLVRKYIQNRYKITLSLLELLIYLAPKQYFTNKDYLNFPKQYHYRRVEDLQALEYARVVMEGANQSKRLFALSQKGMAIVVHFYQILSGEKQIPVRSEFNPMMKKNAKAIDKKTNFLIEQLRNMPVPESRRKLFE